ncbi:hypothetical protein [Nonomuraea basaltis]|uniref:hypothetical protein n=1 Tax=Nonomuraea basaltis TaxID=2495887 RepID=UPI00110C449E|nr:hypothetical protein [Nonomuraea basaltis]TMR91992.1 hypothetical protein EJK15_47090 [Nonomuraea basaltis]
MPVHALAGHLVIITAPLATLVALVYAWRPTSRRGMRLPLVVFSVLNAALAIWAGTAGSALLGTLRTTAQGAGQTLSPTVLSHAHEGDYLTLSSVVLVVAVLTVVWWVLAPGREKSAGAIAASWVLTAAVVAVWWFTGTTLAEALESVWSHHTLWKT